MYRLEPPEYTKDGRVIKYCNCAGCNTLLLGAAFRDWYFEQTESAQNRLPMPVERRVLDRPYCCLCLPYALSDAGLSLERIW